MSDKAYLTREGYNKLKEELKHLKTVVRKEVTQQIQVAREHGDLSENAEYDAAKEKQARVEYKIHQLQNTLGRAEILEQKKGEAKEVIVGASVELESAAFPSKVIYTLVDASEADFSAGKISINSPIAQGLLGHKEGEEVDIQTPSGILKFKICSIK